MTSLIIRLIIYSLAVLITVEILPGVVIDSWLLAIIVAGVLAILNATVKPFLIVLTIPITVFTLGLFLLVINTLIILLTDALIPGFDVDGFWWALLFSLVVSFINSVFASLSQSRG